MSTKKPPNDRIIANVQERGYCCPLSFFCRNTGKNDSNARLAEKADVGYSTIQFNKRKLRRGEITCTGEANCQFQSFTDAYVHMRNNGEIGEPKDD